MTNMSDRSFVRVSKGYVDVPTMPGECTSNRFYCEVWFVAATLQLQTRIYNVGGYTISHYGNTWREGGSYIYTYFEITHGGKWPHSINDYMDRLVDRTNLHIWKESRKWLTKEEKEVAHMLAVESIGILDAEQLLKCDVSDFPQVFHEEVSAFRNEYYEYLRRKDYALYKSLNTYEGLTECLRMAKNSGDKPAVTWFNQLIWELTELWEK